MSDFAALANEIDAGQSRPESFADLSAQIDKPEPTKVEQAKQPPPGKATALQILGAFDQGLRENTLSAISSQAASAYGGLKGIAKTGLRLLNGDSTDEALAAGAKSSQEAQDKYTYQPKSPVGLLIQKGLQDPKNPLNYPAEAGQYAGDKTLDVTGSPALATAVETGINAVPYLYGLKAAEKAPATKTAPSPENWLGSTQGITQKPSGPVFVRESALSPEPVAVGQAAEAQAPVVKISGPVPGGLPSEVHPANADILKRVGLENVRASAVEGDAMNAAVDYQLSKYNEPAGVAAKEQFANERQALQNHATSVVEKTGGSLGMGEDDLHVRGQAIAAPFDALRDYFKQAKDELYNQALKSTEGVPAISTEHIDSLLNDRSFKNSLMAQDKGHLLSAMQDQLASFKENNPSGITVPVAEQFRKWLNKQWSPQNSVYLGEVKEALDNDVFKAAGEDVYAKGRQMHILEKQTLDNPNGISKLFDVDPQTPINRATAYKDISDRLTKLDPDQFNHVVTTLKNMPEELQPQAQGALAEIKAHLANKLLEAGSKTQGQWNAPAVSKILKDNQVKFKSVFSPEELQSIDDLQQAGNLLRVDASYPGASAQAANSLKRGMMSNAIRPAAAWLGGLTGGALGLPSVGAGVGDLVGAKAAVRAGEAGALKDWNNRLVKLKDIDKP